MTPHTQGPWKLAKEYTRGEFVTEYRIRDSRNSLICTIGPNAQDANGALIAAAPELLADLQRAIELLQQVYGADAFIRDALETINKATRKE